MSSSSATIDRLPQLQNLIKRDPDAYVDEFRLQHAAFQAELALLRAHPNADSESFRQLAMFVAHVCTCYKAETAEFPGQLMSLLADHAPALDGDVRRTVAQALMLLRNRAVLAPLPLLKVFFGLFRVQDKYLRELIFSHIVNDIKNINNGTAKGLELGAGTLALGGAPAAGAGAAAPSAPSSGSAGAGGMGGTINRAIQGFLYTMLGDDSPAAAKRSLDVIVELYRRRVWTDARTVNVIATALLSPRPKLMVTALKFFLGMTDKPEEEGSDDDDDSSDGEGGTVARHNNSRTQQVDKKKVEAAKGEIQHVKKTRKRLRAMAKHLATMRKTKASKRSDGQPLFPAIQLLHDPQGLAEKLFAAVRKGDQRFEVRLLALNLLTRLVGQHRLLVLPLYSYLQRYLSAHQQHVTQLLAYLCQACHDLVPPDELAPVVRAIAHAFISDGCAPEVVQVGLNSLREVFLRCPGVLTEEGMGDLVSDLVLYRKAKNKGVVAGARAILNLVREWYPALLRKRDRGVDVATDADRAAARPTAYGAVRVATGVEGADLLALALARKAQRKRRGGEDWEDDDDDDEEDDEDDELAGMNDDEDDAGVGEAEIAAVEDADEWARVRRAKERALVRKGLKTATSPATLAAVAAATAASNKVHASAAGVSSTAPRRLTKKVLDSIIMGGTGDGKKDAADLVDFLLADEEGGDDDEKEEGEEADACGDDYGHDHRHGEEEEDDEDDEEDDEEEDEEEDDEEDDDDDDDDDEEEDEEEDEGEDEAPAKPAAGRKRGRREAEEDDDEAEESASASHHHHHHHGAHKASSVSGHSLSTAFASERAALVASVAPLLAAGAGGKKRSAALSAAAAAASSSSAPTPFPLEATRILTPKDFARIKAIQAKLAERGMAGATAKDILRRLQERAGGGSSVGLGTVLSGAGGSSTGAGSRREPEAKRRRRGGRGLGVVDDDGNVVSESEEEGGLGGGSGDEDQLAVPGASYAPAIVSMDHTALESYETAAKRKQAERLVDVLQTKAKGRKWEGTTPGGGLTNKEKDRKKNYLMLRKSRPVQGKLRADLKAQDRAIKKHLKTNSTTNWKSKARRRRT
jgi:protein SDA1